MNPMDSFINSGMSNDGMGEDSLTIVQNPNGISKSQVIRNGTTVQATHELSADTAEQEAKNGSHQPSIFDNSGQPLKKDMDDQIAVRPYETSMLPKVSYKVTSQNPSASSRPQTVTNPSTLFPPGVDAESFFTRKNKNNQGTSAMSAVNSSIHNSTGNKKANDCLQTQSSQASDKNPNYTALQPKPMNAMYPDYAYESATNASTFYRKNFQGRVTTQGMLKDTLMQSGGMKADHRRCATVSGNYTTQQRLHSSKSTNISQQKRASANFVKDKPYQLDLRLQKNQQEFKFYQILNNQRSTGKPYTTAQPIMNLRNGAKSASTQFRTKPRTTQMAMKDWSVSQETSSQRFQQRDFQDHKQVVYQNKPSALPPNLVQECLQPVNSEAGEQTIHSNPNLMEHHEFSTRQGSGQPSVDETGISQRKHSNMVRHSEQAIQQPYMEKMKVITKEEDVFNQEVGTIESVMNDFNKGTILRKTEENTEISQIKQDSIESNEMKKQLNNQIYQQPLEVNTINKRRDSSPFMKAKKQVISTVRNTSDSHMKRNSFNVSGEVSPLRSPARLQARTNKNDDLNEPIEDETDPVVTIGQDSRNIEQIISQQNKQKTSQSSLTAHMQYSNSNQRRKPVIIGQLISVQKGTGQNIQFMRNNSEFIQTGKNAGKDNSPVTLHDNKHSLKDSSTYQMQHGETKLSVAHVINKQHEIETLNQVEPQQSEFNENQNYLLANQSVIRPIMTANVPKRVNSISQGRIMIGGNDDELRVRQVQFQPLPSSRKQKVHSSYGTRGVRTRQTKKEAENVTTTLISTAHNQLTLAQRASETTLVEIGSQQSQLFNNKLIQNNTQNKLELVSSKGNCSTVYASKKAEKFLDTQLASPSATEKEEKSYGRQSSCNRFKKRQTNVDHALNPQLAVTTDKKASIGGKSSLSGSISPKRLNFILNKQTGKIMSKDLSPSNEQEYMSDDPVRMVDYQTYEKKSNTGMPVANTSNEQFLQIGRSGDRLNEFNEELDGMNLQNFFSAYGGMTHQRTQQNKVNRAKKLRTRSAQRNNSEFPMQFMNAAVGTAVANQHLLNATKGSNMSRTSSGLSGSCLDLMPSFKRLVPKSQERRQANVNINRLPKRQIFEHTNKEEQIKILSELFEKSALHDLLFPNNYKPVMAKSAGHEGFRGMSDMTSDESPSEADSDEDEGMEAAVVIQMLATLRMKNKNIDECLQHYREIDIEQIQHDIFFSGLKQRAQETIEQMDKKTQRRLKLGYNLYKKIVQNPGTNFPAKVAKTRIEKQIQKDKQNQENPFYKALEQNKRQREEQLQMEVYDKKSQKEGLPLPQLEQLEINDKSEESSEEIVTAQTREANVDVNVFTHTQVDLPEKNKFVRNQMRIRTEDYIINEETEQNSIENTNQCHSEEVFFKNSDGQASGKQPSEVHQIESEVTPKQSEKVSKEPENFSFYAMNVELPLRVLNLMGDWKRATIEQIDAIKSFICGTWPELYKRKLNFKVAVEDNGNVFNVLAQRNTMKDSFGHQPLSNCCKMVLNFQFSKQLGGRILCMESLCAQNPVQNFYIEDDLYEILFYNMPEQEVKKSTKKRKINTKKLQKAISSEISKRVRTGSIKQVGLTDIIGNENFQQKNLKEIVPIDDLMGLITSFKPIVGNENRKPNQLSQKRQQELKRTLDQITDIMGFSVPQFQMPTTPQVLQPIQITEEPKTQGQFSDTTSDHPDLQPVGL